MGEIVSQHLNLTTMKRTIYFLAVLAIVSACNDGKQTTENSEPQIADSTTTELTETTTIEAADIAYMECPLAYLVNGELFFYSLDDNINVKFVEESEPIFNFTFDTEGETLYYSVEREGSLWLKTADISKSTISPQWLVDWELVKKEFISDTDGGPTPLYFYKGELVSRYNYSYDSYDFDKIAIYSLANKKITRKENDYSFLAKVYGELSPEKSKQNFQAVDEQLYYSNNNTKVALTNSLNLEEIKREMSEEYWNETEFTDYTFSPDKTKILFGALVWQGEVPFGRYCISNIDGSKQMILEQSRTDVGRRPIWLKNNKIAFKGDENKLFVADNDKNSIRQIAENVMIYVAR